MDKVLQFLFFFLWIIVWKPRANWILALHWRAIVLTTQDYNHTWDSMVLWLFLFIIAENYLNPKSQSWELLDWQQSKCVNKNATKQHCKVPSVTSSCCASQFSWSSTVICVGAGHTLPQAHLVFWGRRSKDPHQFLCLSLGIRQRDIKHVNGLDFFADSRDHSSTGLGTRLLWRSMAETQKDFGVEKNLGMHLFCLQLFQFKRCRSEWRDGL